jgi:hypothetical protein
MPFRSHPPELWAQVREAYRAGMTAGDCARRFGVSASRLAGRAASEGWRRLDEPPQPRAPVALQEEASAPFVSPEDAPRAACERATRAIAAGDPLSAMRWVKVATLARALPGGMDEAAAQAAEVQDAGEIAAMLHERFDRLARQHAEEEARAAAAATAPILGTRAELAARMQAAVDAQAFEEAARLRDALCGLDAGEGGG